MNIVTGVFDSARQAMDTVTSLTDAGFDGKDIGIVTHDADKGAMLARDMHRDYTDAQGGMFTSEKHIFQNMPDGFVEDIKRSNLHEEAVGWYRDRVNEGLILVTASVGERMDDAERIVHEHGGWLYGEERKRTRGATPEAKRTREGELHLPVTDEEVVIEKTERQVGEVRVTPEIRKETKEFPATVTHEEMRVERRKLDRPLSPDEYKGTATDGGEVRMPIIEEDIHVTKRPIIREELVVTRIPVSEQQTIRETVTHTEPHVETSGDVPVEGMTEEERARRRKMPPAA